MFKKYVWNGLGNAYAFGNGVKADIGRGIAYYDKAIALGYELSVQNRAHFKKNLFGKWKQIQ